MDKTDRIVITGAGLVTPVGFDRFSATAAVRAGISRIRELSDFSTPTGARCAGGFASGLTADRSGSDRLLAMAGPAFQEALFMAEQFYGHIELRKSHLMLCLGPSERPSFEAFDEDDLATLLELADAQDLSPRIEVYRGGHAVGITALSKALALLRETETMSCVVGAVDCLVEYPALCWLDETGRLKTEQRSAGFTPGEAAGFIVLERESMARRRGAPVLAEILAPCIAQESAHILSSTPLFGHGLAQAISQTLALSQVAIHAIMCDINGEYYRTKEWVLAASKVFESSGNIPEPWHPVENIGDIGAASTIVFAAMAATAAERQYFPGPNILVWTSSDDGTRGAMVVRGAPQANGALP